MSYPEVPFGKLAHDKGALIDGPFGSNLKASEYVDSGVPIIRLQNIKPNEYFPKDIKYISRSKAKTLSRHSYKAGDVVIAKLGAVGTACIVPVHCEDGVIVADVVRFRSDQSKISHSYLSFFLNSSEGQKRVKQFSKGTTRLRTNLTDLKKVQIPLPPLDDQKRIAYLLGKVEGLIARRKQHLQQLDNLLKSVFLEMFSPHSPGYEAWPLVEIKNLAAKHKGAMRTGPFGSNLLHSEFSTEGDVAVLGIDNAVQNHFAWGERRFISKEKYKELQNYRIFPGDVIVTIMGTIGRSAVIPDDIPVAINTKHLAAITLNKEIANPLFLSYSIHSSPYILNQFRSKNRGAIMNGLNLGIIKETKLKRPPIDLQNQFAAIHTRVDEVKSRYQQSLADLENLYGALSQKAFKGTLDLSRIALPDEQQDGMAEEYQPQEIHEVNPALGSLELSTPDIEALLDLATPDGRKRIIEQWLKECTGQMRVGETFSAQLFLEKVLNKMIELDHDGLFEDWGRDGEPKVTVADYDNLKDMIFKLVENGTLIQAFATGINSLQVAPA
ncbi:restriction endonuclease subunit S [Salidesulfovibrio onnuriiensis]|uniref:restriction endonuclease subunit S n=1 Tax=Salidesulfovibrio onnuriiensis TaxID=2583823 RepID=UPI0011C7DD87|nr:restriction endonuclease subunit S [Salidesulfovibrio onnuriiensis]